MSIRHKRKAFFWALFFFCIFLKHFFASLQNGVFFFNSIFSLPLPLSFLSLPLVSVRRVADAGWCIWCTEDVAEAGFFVCLSLCVHLCSFGVVLEHKGVVHDAVGTHPACLVVVETLLQEVEEVLVLHHSADRLNAAQFLCTLRSGTVLRPAKVKLPLVVEVLCVLWLHVVGQNTRELPQGTLHQAHMLAVLVCFVQKTPCQQLNQNAPHTPNIRSPHPSTPENHLGCSVVAGRDNRGAAVVLVGGASEVDETDLGLGGEVVAADLLGGGGEKVDG